MCADVSMEVISEEIGRMGGWGVEGVGTLPSPVKHPVAASSKQTRGETKHSTYLICTQVTDNGGREKHKRLKENDAYTKTERGRESGTKEW